MCRSKLITKASNVCKMLDARPLTEVTTQEAGLETESERALGHQRDVALDTEVALDSVVLPLSLLRFSHHSIICRQLASESLLICWPASWRNYKRSCSAVGATTNEAARLLPICSRATDGQTKGRSRPVCVLLSVRQNKCIMRTLLRCSPSNTGPSVSVLISLLAYALCLVSGQQQLVPRGPPICEQSYMSDGTSDYNTIANKFFPDATVAQPSFSNRINGSGTSSENEPYNYM